MSTKKLFYSRQFLNKENHYGIGAIYAEITEKGESERYLYHYIAFEISDCNKQIRLEFDLDGGVENIENSLYKLDVLKKTLLGFDKQFRKLAKKKLQDIKKGKKGNRKA